jgi:hypothetical protein
VANKLSTVCRVPLVVSPSVSGGDSVIDDGGGDSVIEDDGGGGDSFIDDGGGDSVGVDDPSTCST